MRTAILLQSHELFRTESLIMNLGSGIYEVLQMSGNQEISKVGEFTVGSIFDIDNPPSVLPTPELLAFDINQLVGAHHSKRNHLSDFLIQGLFLFIIFFLIFIRVEPEIVVGKLLLDGFFESFTLCKGQRVAFGNNRNNISYFRQSLQDNEIYRLEAVPSRLDEEQNTMDSSVGQILLSLGSKLLSQVVAMLILDIFDNGIPALFIIDLISVSWSIDDVKLESHAIFLDYIGCDFDFAGSANGFAGASSTTGFCQRSSKQRVNQSGFSKTRLSNHHQIELESSLEKSSFNLSCNAVEPDWV